MTLNKDKLIENLTNALTVPPDPEVAANRSASIVARALADAIDTFVKTGEVVGITTDVTVTVQTAGSATAQSGTGTGTGIQSTGNTGRIQ